MKKFVLKIILFTTGTLLILSFILMNYGGYVDYFYQKFTVPKQTSFILGDSRSLQGIQPRIFNQELKNSDYDLPMFNYSFTIAQIAYGKPYTESIMKKLQPSTNGLFIVSVHPWLFTEREGDDLKNGIYAERNAPPNNMQFVNVNPNFEYFVKNFKFFHFRSIIRKTANLRKDGWLEESNLPKDSTNLIEWKDNQVNLYKDLSKRWTKSEIRMNDFINLINILQKNGGVVLVRMPVDSKILTVENDFWRNFDNQMHSVSSQQNIKYLNFSENNKYRTYDGNHLDKIGGAIFTKELCDSIKMMK